MRHEGDILITTAAPTGGGAAVRESAGTSYAEPPVTPVRRDGFTLYAEIYAIRLSLPG